MSIQTVTEQTKVLQLESHDGKNNHDEQCSHKLQSHDSNNGATPCVRHKTDDANKPATLEYKANSRPRAGRKKNKNAQPGVPSTTPHNLQQQTSILETDGPQETTVRLQAEGQRDNKSDSNDLTNTNTDLRCENRQSDVLTSGQRQADAACYLGDMGRQKQRGSSTSLSSTPSSSSQSSISCCEMDQSDCGSDYIYIGASKHPSSQLSSDSLISLGDNKGTIKEDFVILNTSEDEEAAAEFKKHLETDIGKPDVTVQMFSSVGIGKTVFKALQELPQMFHFILVFVTYNLCECSHTKFLNEILMTYSIKNGLRNQVIPVWTTKKKQDIMELAVISGALAYWRFKENDNKSLYIEQVRKIINEGRKG